MVIAEYVFGIVKRNCPERSEGRFGGDLGAQGKGAAAPLPLLRRCRRRNSWGRSQHKRHTAVASLGSNVCDSTRKELAKW